MGSLFVVTLSGMIPNIFPSRIWKVAKRIEDDVVDSAENEAMMRNSRIDSRLKSTESAAPVFVCVPCDPSADDIRVIRHSRASRNSRATSRVRSSDNTTTSQLRRDVVTAQEKNCDRESPRIFASTAE